MKPKHTPGPWRIGITKHAVFQVAEPELMVAMCSDKSCDGWDPKTQLLMEQANARLIAAAPDLFETLREIVEQWDKAKKKKNGFTQMTHSAEFWDAINQARAALAKAT